MKMPKNRTGEAPGSGGRGDARNRSQPRFAAWTAADEKKILRDLGNGASLLAVMRLHGVSREAALEIQSLVDG